MELFQVIGTKFYGYLKSSWIVAAPLLLSACATTPSPDSHSELEQSQEMNIEQQTSPNKGKAVEEVVKAEVAPQLDVPQIPLNAELMYYILTAEVAGQRGQMGVAVDLYAKAADLVDSTTLAGRSAQVATYTRDKSRIDRALKRWLEIEPDNADVYIMKAPIALLNKDAEDALKSINQAIALSPENSAEYLTTMADSLRELAEPKLGLTFMRSIDAYKSGDTEASFAVARLALLYKQYSIALEEIEKVLKEQPKRTKAIVIKAEALQRLGRGEESLALLKKATKSQSADEDLKSTYAKTLGENGKTEQAKTLFEELHANHPDNDDYIFALGLIALEKEQFVDAKKYFNLLIKKGDPGKQAAYFMGLAEEMAGNIETALVWYLSVPSSSGRFDSAQTNYISLLGERGEFDKARNHLKLLRKEQPQREIDFYLYEAAFLREHDMNQEAYDLYNVVLQKYPENVDVLYARAMVAESLNMLSVLEEDLKFILQKNPDNADALNALGYTLTDRTNRHEEALVLIKKAVELVPNNAYFLDSLGWVYYRLGDLEKAEKYLRDAIAIQDDAEFLAHLGEVLWNQDRHAEAKKVWADAKKVAADNKILIETMSRYGQ
jgi:tetratricopeptide (TPR) repeat protein